MRKKVLWMLLLSTSLFAKGATFLVHGTGYMYKFGGTLKRRSAVARVYILTEFYRWDNGYSIWGGGSELVWLGRDKGIIQLDPQQADYLITGGLTKSHSSRVYYLFLDHPCYHTIDAPVDRSLYWNKIRIGMKNHDDFFKIPQNGFFYFVELGFFLRHPDIWWLTTGHDFQYDIKANIKRVIKRVGKMYVFMDITGYAGVSMHYSIHPMIEMLFGVGRRGTSGNEGQFVIGYRPLDRKTFREAEGVLYAGIRTNF